MELIKKNYQKLPKTYYKLIVYFSNDKKSEITYDNIENLKSYVFAVACCCAAFPNGKAGYEKYHGLPEFDAFFTEFYYDGEISKYYKTEEEYRKAMDINPGVCGLDYPSSWNHLPEMFESYKVLYYEDNNEFEIDIVFNDEELKRIKECKNKNNWKNILK